MKLIERAEDGGGWAARLSQPRWALTGLGLLTLVSFAPSLRAGFVYDDQWTIVHNSSVRSFVHFSDLWTGKAMREGMADAWRPLMVVSQMLDYHVFGLRPLGHHLHNLLWHLACVLLLYGLCLRVFGARDLALGCAALFAIHPVHVEPVAAINYREDLISTALGLAALLLLWPRGGVGEYPRPRALLGSAALLLGGLLAKESVAVLPLVYLGLCLALPGPATAASRLRSALPGTAALLAAVAAHLAWRWITTGSVDPYPALGSTMPLAGQGFLQRLPTHAEALVRSTAQAIVPLGLSPEYPVVPRSWASAAGLGSVALLLALTTSTAWLLLRRRGLLACAALIWLMGWLPYAGLLSLPNLRADRYAYLPAWGCCLLWAGALLRLPGPEVRRWAVTVLIGVFLVLTIRQQNIWRSELHLWSAASRAAPASVRAIAGLARAQSLAGLHADAERSARHALALAGRSGLPHLILANVLVRANQPARALAHYRSAESLGVRHPDHLYTSWGWALFRLGHTEEAERTLRRAIDRNPGLAVAHANLARVLLAQDRRADAAAALRRAIDLAPEQRSYREELRRLERLELRFPPVNTRTGNGTR